MGVSKVIYESSAWVEPWVGVGVGWGGYLFPWIMGMALPPYKGAVKMLNARVNKTLYSWAFTRIAASFSGKALIPMNIC